jgi:DNA replication protein DnaC
MQGLITKGAQNPGKVSKGLRDGLKIHAERIKGHFSDFQTCGDPILEKALKAAMNFCWEMTTAHKPARWISFLGPSGTGKTFLAKRITSFFRKYLDHLQDERNGSHEMFTRRGGLKLWIDAVSEMQAGDFTGLRELRHDWFLCLDDIGTQRANNEFAVVKLYEVLCARQDLFTVITCNFPLDEIGEKMDARIASRLTRNMSMVVAVDTVDFNQRTKKP